jgi:hypothetical protein
LTSVKDTRGNFCVLTANTIIANPDFEKIKRNNFHHYYYENFTTTLLNRDGNNDVVDLIKEGISKKIYYPQLHGREHVNLNQWLGALRDQHLELLEAFKYGMFGISLQEKINMRKNVMAALDFADIVELKEHQELLTDAQNSFKEIFGFTSKTFISPSYIWHKNHEPILKKIGVIAMQGLPYQYQPNPKGENYKTSYRYTGMQSKSGLTHLVRNAFFEPTLMGTQNIVEDCLKRIEIAFRTRKPAIISSHRINFVGSLDENNRKNNLILFKNLLQNIVEKWHEVEFISSDELASIMTK